MMHTLTSQLVHADPFPQIDEPASKNCGKPFLKNDSLRWTAANGDLRSVEDFRLNFALLETHITQRGGVTYLVRQSIGKYAQSTIIPVICHDGELEFESILQEDKDDPLSSRLRRTIHTGTEYELTRAIPLSSFSWDKIDELVEEKQELVNETTPPEPEKMPGDLLTTPVIVYGPRGYRLKVRQLINPRGSAFSDASSTCYKGCRIEAPVRFRRGLLRGREVVLSLIMDDENISGTYRHEDDNKPFYLRGNIRNGNAVISDCEDEACTKPLGRIKTTIEHHLWMGSWEAADDSTHTSPFFALPDHLL